MSGTGNSQEPDRERRLANTGMYEELLRANSLQTLGVVALGVGHDLNNLLSVIVNSAELLPAEWSDGSARGEIELIKMAAMDAAKVVGRLHQQEDVLRQSGRQPVDMNNVVLDALRFIAPYREELMEVRGVRIEVTFALGNVSSVECNEAELRTVVVNILLNALDAVFQQGGSIAVQTQPAGKFVRMAIHDTGLGMSEEVRERIFDPFFTTKGGGRSGIGLSIAREIIEKAGGEINVDSSLGKGSTITITLPSSPSLCRTGGK
ncbi:MAG: sensor histidine kinase [Dehalococcoidia bacterium]